MSATGDATGWTVDEDGYLYYNGIADAFGLWEAYQALAECVRKSKNWDSLSAALVDLAAYEDLTIEERAVVENLMQLIPRTNR